MKGLHAYSTGKPFNAYSGGRGRGFTAQLMGNRHGQRENILAFFFFKTRISKWLPQLPPPVEGHHQTKLK